MTERSPSQLFIVASIAAVCLMLALGGIRPTAASFSTASITNAPSSAATTSLSASATPQSASTCSGSGPGPVACAGTVFPTATPLTNLEASTTVTNTSPALPGGSYAHSFRINSCTPNQFANSAPTAANNPMISYGGVTRNVTDPWGGTQAARYRSPASANTVTTNRASDYLQGAFSMGMWLRASASTSSGGLLALSTVPTSASDGSGSPIAMSLGSSGLIRFSPLYQGTPGGFALQPGTTNLRDGNWHHVVLTVEPSANGTTLSLFVDGAQTLRTTTTAVVSTSTTPSYWHVGWFDIIFDRNTSTTYFDGDLAGVFVARGALNATQANTLFRSSSSSYAANVPNPLHVWMLGEAATPYTQPLPFVTGSNPCAHVRANVSLGSTSVGGNLTLAQYAAATSAGSGWYPTTVLAAPAPGASTALTVSYSRVDSGTYDPDVRFLELLVSSSYRISLVDSRWAVELQWARGMVQA